MPWVNNIDSKKGIPKTINFQPKEPTKISIRGENTVKIIRKLGSKEKRSECDTNEMKGKQEYVGYTLVAIVCKIKTYLDCVFDKIVLNRK